MTKEVLGQKGLGTADITGAQAGSKNKGMFTWKSREQFGQMPKVYNDVPGCNPDTVKKAITTNRNLNPLDPQYKFPGHTEEIVFGLNAYGPEGSSMANLKVKPDVEP